MGFSSTYFDDVSWVANKNKTAGQTLEAGTPGTITEASWNGLINNTRNMYLWVKEFGSYQYLSYNTSGSITTATTVFTWNHTFSTGTNSGLEIRGWSQVSITASSATTYAITLERATNSGFTSGLTTLMTWNTTHSANVTVAVPISYAGVQGNTTGQTLYYRVTIQRSLGSGTVTHTATYVSSHSLG